MFSYEMPNFKTLHSESKVLDPQLSIFIEPEKIEIGDGARLDGHIKIEGGDGVNIGPFVHIASFSHINVGGGSVIFESHSGCSSHCCIGGASSNWNYLFASAAEPGNLHRKRRYVTRICKYALLFMGVIVLPGRTVGKGAIVLPGTLVSEDVEPWTIIQGNPSKVVGQREIYEYNRSINVQKRSELLGEILRADDGIADAFNQEWTPPDFDFGVR